MSPYNHLLYSLSTIKDLMAVYIVVTIFVGYFLFKVFKHLIFPMIDWRFGKSFVKTFQRVSFAIITMCIVTSIGAFYDYHVFASNGTNALLFYTDKGDYTARPINDKEEKIFRFKKDGFLKITEIPWRDEEDYIIQFTSFHNAIANGFIDEGVQKRTLDNMNEWGIINLPPEEPEEK